MEEKEMTWLKLSSPMEEKEMFGYERFVSVSARSSDPCLCALMHPYIIFIYAYRPPPQRKEKQKMKHTAATIRWPSPIQLLISRFEAYLWLSGREAEFSTICGRMCKNNP